MGRWSRAVGWIMLGLTGWIALGGAMTAVSGTPRLRGQLYDIGGGRRLHLLCAGPADGRPTVLFEAGAFGLSADWGVVQQRLAAKGIRSCAYDRAGLGFSDPGPKPRDGLSVAEDLDKLLAVAGERGPFILCGHSMAGLRLRLFAARNPDKVAGVVLVDATTPEAMDVPLVRRFVGVFSGLSRLAALGAGAGLFKPLTGTGFADKIGLEGAAAADKRWAFASGRHNYWSAEEVVAWPLAAEQARKTPPYRPEWPVAVITAGADRPDRPGWKDLQSAPARASAHGYVRHVPGAEHATLLGTVFANEIVEGVEFVRASAAASQPAMAAG